MITLWNSELHDISYEKSKCGYTSFLPRIRRIISFKIFHSYGPNTRDHLSNVINLVLQKVINNFIPFWKIDIQSNTKIFSVLIIYMCGGKEFSPFNLRLWNCWTWKRIWQSNTSTWVFPCTTSLYLHHH